MRRATTCSPSVHAFPEKRRRFSSVVFGPTIGKNRAALIEAIDLKKQYPREQAPALSGVSLRVEPGQTVALTGPSGSGKTTLLHLLAGLERPTSGSVVLGGKDLSSMNDGCLSKFRRRHVGMVFQFFNLVPGLSVRENVELPLLLDGLGRKERRKRATRRLQEVQLSERLDAYPSELSGGEMQRVAVARALVADPWIVLADEPTGSLDSRQGAAVLDLLRQICSDGNHALFMVTHDAELAAGLERTLQLHDGRLLS